MIVAPLSFLCAGWFFGCWLVAKLVSKVLGGVLKKTVNGAKILWIIPLAIGVVASVNGV
jgi:hypothetical protein